MVEKEHDMTFLPFHQNGDQLELTHKAYYSKIGELKKKRPESEEERRAIKAEISKYKRLDNKCVRLLLKAKFGDTNEHAEGI